MKLLEEICVGLLLLPVAQLWSQVDTTPTVPVPAVTGAAPDSSSDQMMTPPPVSGQSYPTAPTAGERSNYFRGGVAFASAYTDNALGSVNGHPVSDVSYSVWPTLALDKSTSRLHIVSTYAPGFTFYQRETYLNEADQTAAIDLQYRLSPHVSISARDGFQKTSSVFNQPDPTSAFAVSGGTQEANFSIVAPIADLLSNAGNVGITWQFAANAMVGASGTFANQHYPNQAEVPGLFDSSSQGGSVFFTHRISKMHYVGATYQYQRLVSYPTVGQNETQTHALLFFYTLYASSRLSLSFFGGPQYANVGPQYINSQSAAAPGFQSWNPQVGGSMSWQGRLTNVAVSYSHMISGGGGLIGAVKLDSATASIRQQMTRRLSGSIAGGYAQSNVLGSALLGNDDGHSISA
ncbi:MAG: hypothetical protein WCC37_26995, partial [Candidatus Sulfotelmatobacter sp.]